MAADPGRAAHGADRRPRIRAAQRRRLPRPRPAAAQTRRAARRGRHARTAAVVRHPAHGRGLPGTRRGARNPLARRQVGDPRLRVHPQPGRRLPAAHPQDGAGDVRPAPAAGAAADGPHAGGDPRLPTGAALLRLVRLRDHRRPRAAGGRGAVAARPLAGGRGRRRVRRGAPGAAALAGHRLRRVAAAGRTRRRHPAGALVQERPPAAVGGVGRAAADGPPGGRPRGDRAGHHGRVGPRAGGAPAHPPQLRIGARNPGDLPPRRLRGRTGHRPAPPRRPHRGPARARRTPQGGAAAGHLVLGPGARARRLPHRPYRHRRRAAPRPLSAGRRPGADRRRHRRRAPRPARPHPAAHRGPRHLAGRRLPDRRGRAARLGPGPAGTRPAAQHPRG